MKNNFCVIMAGGVGSRFWPMSTSELPKQFHDILGTGKTMIQQTYDRISRILPRENIMVITNKEYVGLIGEQLPEIPKENIIGEPMIKNTAACNIYMANKIACISSDANLVVLPADHLILKEDVFLEKIKFAFEEASNNDYLITLGIRPTRPDTGYGYIQYEENSQSNSESILKVKTFTEKPDLGLAKVFLEAGDFLWNAGIFVWNVKTIIRAFEKYLPEMIHQFNNCEYNGKREVFCIETIYPKVNKISIDNGILEKADNVYVIPSDLGWSDLGTWTSVYENSEKDKEGNTVSKNKVILHNSKGNVVCVKNKNKILVLDGLLDYIIVDTEKVLLICPKSHDQLIKEYLLELKNIKGGDKYL